MPAQPDAAALEKFLLGRRQADPLRFPDVSLAVVKLMGRGEYALQMPGEVPVGHFGLAVKDYAQVVGIQPWDLGYFLLARALEQNGQMEAAKAAMDEARRLSEDFDQLQRTADSLLKQTS